MRTLLLVFLIIVGLGAVSMAQRRSSTTTRNARISKARASVYITFVRHGKISAASTGEIEDTVWLRLHNKSRWPIVLDMNGVPSKKYGDASLFHDVLSEGKLVFEDRCHVCSFNKLWPGRSLVFTVPLEDLAKGNSIRVKFSFNREGESSDGGREIEDFVYFDSAALPKYGR